MRLLSVGLLLGVVLKRCFDLSHYQVFLEEVIDGQLREHLSSNRLLFFLMYNALEIIRQCNVDGLKFSV